MQMLYPTIVAQLDFLSGILGVVVMVIGSFVLITLVSSYYRFQNVVQQAEKMNPEDIGSNADEVLRVQMARYLAGCARRGTSFSLSLINVRNSDLHVGMETSVFLAVKHAARCDDVACVFDGQTIALLTEAEPEDSVGILQRIAGFMVSDCAALAPEQLRVGIASYPGHGLRGRELIDVAAEGLEQTTFEEPIVLPKIEDVDAEDDEDESELEDRSSDDKAEAVVDDAAKVEGTTGWNARRGGSMLDEVTGVLKPSAISAYMQRMMNEIKRKKQKAALFCIGVNNMDHIARFHGDEAADDVMAGVSKILQDHMRADDLIGRHEQYAFLVLALCSIDEAELIGKRVTTLVQQKEFISGRKKLKTSITLGVSLFPEHGRNLHLLYSAGQKVLDYSRMNDIRAYAVYNADVHDKVPAKPMRSIKSAQA